MKKGRSSRKEFNVFNDQVITNGRSVFMIYIIISVLSLTGVNVLANMMFKDVVKIQLVLTISGIIFLLATASLMWLIINKYNKLVSLLRQAYSESEVMVDKLSYDNEKRRLYTILTDYLMDEQKDEEAMVIELFEYIIKRIGVCDLGSALVMKDNEIRFVAARGFDLESLNKTFLKYEEIEFYTVGIHLNKDVEKRLQTKLGSTRYEEYVKDNPRISESVYVGLLDEQDIKLSYSLDISLKAVKEDGTYFTDDALREIKELQVLITALFKMKSLVKEKSDIQKDVAMSFIKAFEYHDEYTKGHLYEVARISALIGQCLGLDPESKNELYWSALLHDVGKIIIPREVLVKPGKLTDEEYKLVQQHCASGERFLSESKSLAKIGKNIRWHHERYDGSGYPDGLKGEEIPLVSRIICLADSYHAMISARPYRKALDQAYVLQEIINNDGKQFCPVVTEAFLQMYDKVKMKDEV